MTDPFAPVGGDGPTSPPGSVPDDRWALVVPVPADAPPVPESHRGSGTASARWTYRDETGAELGQVLRFDANGSKTFRPLTLWRDRLSGKLVWKWRSWPEPRPLYGLDALAGRPDAPVVVVEGEKACEAARTLLPDHVVVTSPGGAAAPAKADWRPLAGRHVVIWPDDDHAGRRYADEVRRLLREAGSASCTIVALPDDLPAGWDAADALQEGLSEEDALALIGTRPGRRRRTSPRSSGTRSARRAVGADKVLELMEGIELWHNPQGVSFATVPVDDHHEHHPIRSSRFADVVRYRCFEKTGSALPQSQLDAVLDHLDTCARFKGKAFETFRRSAWIEEAIYIDLCDAEWRVVRITPHGWSVVKAPHVKLLRSPGSRPLPAPEGGYEITELGRFLNLESEDDLMLVACWAVAALAGKGPYPILTISGEQGSAKSVGTRVLRTLVDPHALPHRALPETDRELAIAACNTHVLAFDNVSSIRPATSDTPCRLATGGGFATRKLHTDADEILIFTANPVVMNGIPDLASRPDLADRCIALHLPRIAQDRRRAEEAFWEEFAFWHPRILGTLCDGLVRMLSGLPATRLSSLPRMADFAKRSVAACPGLGFEADAFLQAFASNQRSGRDTAFENDPVAVALLAFLEARGTDEWDGTATDLVRELDDRAPPETRRDLRWPSTPAALGTRINRISPLLRDRGWDVERKHSGDRRISFRRARSAA